MLWDYIHCYCQSRDGLLPTRLHSTMHTPAWSKACAFLALCRKPGEWVGEGAIALLTGAVLTQCCCSSSHAAWVKAAHRSTAGCRYPRLQHDMYITSCSPAAGGFSIRSQALFQSHLVVMLSSPGSPGISSLGLSGQQMSIRAFLIPQKLRWNGDYVKYQDAPSQLWHELCCEA